MVRYFQKMSKIKLISCLLKIETSLAKLFGKEGSVLTPPLGSGGELDPAPEQQHPLPPRQGRHRHRPGQGGAHCGRQHSGGR